MENSTFTVFFIIFLVSILIYIIKNSEELKEIINKIKYNIIYKCLCGAFAIFIIVLGSFYFNKELRKIKENIEYLAVTKKNNEIYNECEKEIVEQNKFYISCMSKVYEEKYSTPYILEGFKYIEGEWYTGFVIEDEKGNQFVWIPVSNKDINNVAKLVKKDFIVDANIQKEYCFDENYGKFIESALENGGFYISRYELGIEENNIVSKKGKKIYKDFIKSQAEEKVKTIYNGKDFNCELINGYAYDTTIDWLNIEENIKTFYFDTNKELFTGRNSIKNIFDMFDNIFEYTRRN